MYAAFAHGKLSGFWVWVLRLFWQTPGEGLNAFWAVGWWVRLDSNQPSAIP